MRSLHANLAAEQKLYTATPYVRVYLESADTITTYILTTADTPTRIFAVTQREECWGGIARVQLKNTDHYFKTKNLRGYKVQLGWGYSCDTDRYSNAPDMWVIGQRDRSERGELITELLCIDLWNILDRTMVAAGGTKLTGAITKNDGAIQELATGGTSGATGFIYYIGEGEVRVSGVTGTFEAETVTSTNLTMTVSAADAIGSGGASLGWSGNTDVKDIITSLLSGWASFTLDSDDPSANADTYTPTYELPFGATIRAIIKDVLDFTECGLRAESDGVHMMYLDPSPASPDYEYKLDDASYHKFAEEVRNRYLVTPNRVYAISAVPSEGPVEFISDPPGIDADSYNALGSYLTRIVSMDTICSDDDADARASALINRYKAELNTGDVEVPLLNCGQELLDWVQITDARADSIVITGRVGMIERVYESGSGKFSMTIRLGGLTTNADVSPEGVEIPNGGTAPARPISKYDPIHTPPWSDILPKAIQGYQHDVTFSATDWDTVSWVGGADAIKFYDGTTQTIANGNTGNLGSDAIRYIYFDLSDANPNVLKVTTDYKSVMTMQTGLLCLVQRGSAVGILATFIPSYGKEPLITPDFIDMTGLKEYTYVDGTKIQGIFSTQIQAGSIYLSAATSFASDYNPTDKFDLGDDSLDNVANGSTHHKVLATHIDAGKLKLTSAAVKDGAWYNESGIEIEAGVGITIDSGTGGVSIFKFKHGATQGKIYLDSAGGMVINCDEWLYLDPGAAYGVSIDTTNTVRPTTAGDMAADLGTSSLQWDDVHCDRVVEYCSVPTIKSALDKVKVLKSKRVKLTMDEAIQQRLGKKDKERLSRLGEVEMMDFDSFPTEILSIPTEEDIQDARKAYESDVIHYQMKGKDADKLIPFQPKTGVALGELVWMLTMAVQELSEKVERLEGGNK